MIRCSTFLLLTLLATNPLQAGSVRGVWEQIAPLPSARQEVGVTILDQDVYVLGGLVPGGATASVQIYDVATDSWSAGPDLPSSRHHVAAAAVGGRVYSIGGFLGFSFSPTNSLLELDPAGGVWLERSPMPLASGALAAGVIDGLIYAVGGTTFGGDTGALNVYDPEQNSWQSRTPMPTPRDHHAAGVINGELYVVGGRLGGNLATLEIYDPAQDSWRQAAPMPTARSGLAAAVVGGLLFVFGGEIPGVFDETEVYDPETDSWFSLEPMALPRHGIGAAVFEERILIPGGATRQGLGATALGDQFVVLSQLDAMAQFADSPQIVSQVLIRNFGDRAARYFLELRSDPGDLLVTRLDGAEGSQFGGVLEAGAGVTLSTPGQALPPLVGAALLFSDRPLQSHVLFSSDFGFAGVASLRPLNRFAVPVQTDLPAALNSGIALANASAWESTVRLVLTDLAGVELGVEEVVLPPFGHQARFLTQLFAGIDLTQFEGSLFGSADHLFAALALLTRDDQLATLPVRRLE